MAELPMENENTAGEGNETGENEGNLDHALLESIFYSEMMLMDDSASLISSSLLSTLAADGSVLREPQNQEQTESQPNSIASENTQQQSSEQQHLPSNSAKAKACDAADPSAAVSAVTNPVPIVAKSEASGDKPSCNPTIPAQPQQRAGVPRSTITARLYSPSAAPASSEQPSPKAKPRPRKKKQPPAPPVAPPPLASASSHAASVPPATPSTPAAPPSGATAAVSAAAPQVVSTNSSAATSAAPLPSPVEDGEKRQKLVSQFAALAARLGITLPEPVVQSLTNNNQQEVQTSFDVGSTNALPGPLGVTSNGVSTGAASDGATKPTPLLSAGLGTTSRPAPVVQQLADAADAAVRAAANRKRPATNGTTTNSGAESNAGDSGGETNTLATAAATRQAPYSKRRKKPRLQDCESQLAELQAENAMLKRHLANLSSQTQAMDQERHMQQQRMRLMLEEHKNNSSSISQEEMGQAVKHFTEMYSDYGRRRHQELAFHLDQLQRLANPTNFTKLGLYSMGGPLTDSSLSSSSVAPSSSTALSTATARSASNPIAGILQKELGISAQQGKKILEQRKRIQEVCGNLKKCLGLLANLKALCKQKTQIFHDRMSKCREILTPHQVVQLILWIDENSGVLESVCPGWGSEQNISSTGKGVSSNGNAQPPPPPPV